MTGRGPASQRVTIIETGVGNTASVMAAFARLGIAAERANGPASIRNASAVVLPGVGAFGPGLAALRGGGLDSAIIDRVRAGSPLLAICLGLQMLCASSDESPGATGLSVLPAAVARFGLPASLRLPHMGWNTVSGDGPIVRPGHAYFAHSFRVSTEGVEPPEGWSIATTEYGGGFIAAVERGPVVACQFHPELSGSWGLGLLARWARTAGLEATCTIPAGEAC